MQWVRDILNADIGSAVQSFLNLRAERAKNHELHVRFLKGSRRDRAQDARITALEGDRDTLEATLTALVRILHAKNVITKDELEALASEVMAARKLESERAEQEAKRLAEQESLAKRKKRRAQRKK